MKSLKIIVALLAFLTFNCASTVGVLSEFDAAVDFENYSSFVICIDDLYVENTKFPEYDNNQVRDMIGSEIESQMEARDHQTNVLEPELQAGFTLLVEEKEAEFHNCDVQSEYEYWKECSIDTYVYTEETLVLYVSDIELNQVIWQASIQCDMNRSKTKLEPYVASLIEKLFNEYPKVPNSSL
jgi:hypothetical protein